MRWEGEKTQNISTHLLLSSSPDTPHMHTVLQESSCAHSIPLEKPQFVLPVRLSTCRHSTGCRGTAIREYSFNYYIQAQFSHRRRKLPALELSRKSLFSAPIAHFISPSIHEFCAVPEPLCGKILACGWNWGISTPLKMSQKRKNFAGMMIGF